uniref:Uncharacterized protein n=1 Tax=Timema douglasi TaxID=61478 RepID=A0A7R8VYP2_TIMDO|nr:unnamed protein product [Timema douglasi]
MHGDDQPCSRTRTGNKLCCAYKQLADKVLSLSLCFPRGRVAPIAKQRRGHTAEYYQQHPERLTHQKLLKDHGASEEIAEDSLSDKVRCPVETRGLRGLELSFK